jgi:hypothetical protein
MSVKTTRIIGYGIYMPYQEFKSKFSSEDEFEEFCDAHSKFKKCTPCFVGEYMDGEWVF